MSKSSRSVVSFLLASAFLLAGCEKTVKHTVGRYSPGSELTVEPVKSAGFYHVKYADTSGDKLRKVERVGTWLARGEMAGFETQDDGKVVAIAGPRRIVLDELPDDVTRCVWYHKSKRETQFGREMRDFGEGAAYTAMFTGLVAGALAITSGTIYLNSEADKYERSQSSYPPPRHKHR